MSADTITLQLKWRHQFQFAGYYAAIEQGYYREKGLDVVLKEARPGMNIADELVSGRADFAVALPDMLIERQNGKPVVALAAIFQHSPLALFAAKRSGITNPQDIAGKTLMLQLNNNAEIYAMLLMEGVRQSQFTVVPHTWDINDLIQGKVDATTGYVTDMPLSLREKGFEYLMIRPITYGVDFYGDCLFTTEKQIREHPQRVEKFLAATLKGWDYAMAHPEETTDLIIRKYHPRHTRKELLFEAGAMRDLILPNLIEIGHMNPGRWRHIANTLVKLRMLKPQYSLAGFLYNPHEQRYMATKRMVTIALSVVVAVVLLAAGLLLFNRKLQRLVAEKTSELEAEQLLSEAIIDSLPGNFFMFEDGKRLVRWNKMFKKISGLTDNELFGHPALEFIAEKDRDKVEHAIQTAMETGSSNVEAMAVFQGKAHPYYHSASVLNINGKTYLLGVSIDITARKKLEEQLQHARKMESVGRLAGGVAHDFNNVLTAILGHSELLLTQLPENTPYRESVAGIHNAGKNAANLVRQLLAFGRKQILEKKTVSINDIANGVLNILHNTLGDDIVIESMLNATKGTIDADRGQIEQVLINLIFNARDAMPNGGKILIETQDLTLDGNYQDTHPDIAPGTYVMIAVSDDGKGMASNVLKHIFDPFYTTKKQGKGTGLGLATVYGIVKQHNGHILPYSEPGKGTVFKIYFPATEGAAIADDTGGKPASLEPGTETIMVVDDETYIRKFIVDTLESLGYKCVQASNGAEALDVFREYSDSIDLLLTDVVMPGISGKELAEQILGEYPDVKVVFMSGYTENTIAHHGVLDQGVNYIPKPITPIALTRKIRSVLDE